MHIIHTLAELRKTVTEYKQSGKCIALVPTMGNLHQGHLQLVDRALTQADVVVCSIFVNPLQFTPGEDYEQYPRTLQKDAEQLDSVGCDIVFAPSVEEMYPHSQNNGLDQCQIMIPFIGDMLEGAARPGHFNGVATVVAKLFNMVQPDKAVFGAKDYQQLQVIKQFVRDLAFPVEIIAHPIVRDRSGLALSSRNAYLMPQQRQQAVAIYQTLNELERKIKSGARDYAQLEQEAANNLNAQGFNTDYISIRATDLSLPKANEQQLVILAASYLGTTRLLDNIEIKL